MRLTSLTRTFTFTDPDREWSAMYLRAELRKLWEAEKKDYNAIKILYTILLEEESQDLARRRVEVAERESEREIAPVEKKSLSVAEVKERVRVLLGKQS
jgi:hypothetical protein